MQLSEAETKEALVLLAAHALQGLLASGEYTHIDGCRPEVKWEVNHDFEAGDPWDHKKIVFAVEDAMDLAERQFLEISRFLSHQPNTP